MTRKEMILELVYNDIYSGERDEFIKREREMLDNGTTMVFPLPNIEFVL